jgi:hypothetical protein
LLPLGLKSLNEVFVIYFDIPFPASCAIDLEEDNYREQEKVVVRDLGDPWTPVNDGV